MFRISLLRSLALPLVLGACAMAPADDDLAGSSDHIGDAERAVSGTPSPPPASVVRIRRTGDGATHTGILVGNAGSSSLVLTSERWATWQSNPGSVTIGVPAAGGTFVSRPARFINNTHYFSGAVIQIASAPSQQLAIDGMSPQQLIGRTARCYEYVSDTQTHYVDIRFVAAAGDQLGFEYPWGGQLSSGDAGAPCIRDGSYLVGFVIDADPAGGDLQHAGSMAPWLDGMRNLAAVRDDPRSSIVAIQTRPNATDRMCLDLAWGSPYPQGAINQYRCHAGPAQRWWLDFRVDGSDPRLVSDASGLCMDITGGGTASGLDLQSYPCHTGLNQRFDRLSLLGGGIRLRPRNSAALSNCVSIEGGASTASRRAEQRPCAAAPASNSDQRWYLQFDPPYTP